MADVKQDAIRGQLTDENFTDVIEEGIRQAARATTQERREYIARVIASGVSDDNLDFIETKHLLRILGEINDIEILWLRYYLNPYIGHDGAFREKHKKVFDRVPAFVDGSQELCDKLALQESYSAHLARLNLLDITYDSDHGSDQPKLRSGELVLSGYRLSGLGRVLLAHMGLTVDRS
ncbi:MAG: hypothetical protein ABI073_02975 [Luteolibacter sp.]